VPLLTAEDLKKQQLREPGFHEREKLLLENQAKIRILPEAHYPRVPPVNQNISSGANSPNFSGSDY
jgi:hypothetical protein